MKLLPCPFCGGEPEEDGGMFFEFYGHERQDYSIACKRCRAEVRCDVGEHEGADAPCSCHHDTRKICAEKWNRRAAMLQGARNHPEDNLDMVDHSGDANEKGNSPVIQDGWVILPADPTQAMMNAWLSEVANWRGHASGYRAMIAAAPKPEA